MYTHLYSRVLLQSDAFECGKRDTFDRPTYIRGLIGSFDGKAFRRGSSFGGCCGHVSALVPEIVAAVQKKVPVHVDGGIRHGTDVFKALALGADFVWIGRPVLWGLAYKGQQGVELCLKLIMDEFRLCMALAGVVRVEEISKEYLVRVDTSGFVSRL